MDTDLPLTAVTPGTDLPDTAPGHDAGRWTVTTWRSGDTLLVQARECAPYPHETHTALHTRRSADVPQDCVLAGIEPLTPEAFARARHGAGRVDGVQLELTGTLETTHVTSSVDHEHGDTQSLDRAVLWQSGRRGDLTALITGLEGVGPVRAAVLSGAAREDLAGHLAASSGVEAVSEITCGVPGRLEIGGHDLAALMDTGADVTLLLGIGTGLMIDASRLGTDVQDVL